MALPEYEKKIINLASYLKNSWSSNGIAEAYTIHKKIKAIHISIRNGSSTEIMTLPEELRPSMDTLIPATNGSASSYVRISKNGKVEVSSAIFISGASNLICNAIYS